MPRVRSAIIFTVGSLCACHGNAALTAADAGPTIGRVVSYTPLPDPDPAVALPTPSDGGAFVLSGTQSARLVWTPPTPGPMTAASSCTRWITGCISKDRTLDDCARSVPQCKTQQPWNEPACCPTDCFDRYRDARLQGSPDKDAFLTVYLGSTNPCIPGLAALVRGQR